MAKQPSNPQTDSVQKLYRHFSQDGELLYVGITARFPDRIAHHSRHARWWADVARIEIETFPDRESVLAAEAKAIKTEFPVFNIRLKEVERVECAPAPAWSNPAKVDPARPKPMRIMRPHQTSELVGLCDRQLRELEHQGLFPRRFSLNPSGNGRAVGHLESEVDDWITARAAERSAA